MPGGVGGGRPRGPSRSRSSWQSVNSVNLGGNMYFFKSNWIWLLDCGLVLALLASTQAYGAKDKEKQSPPINPPAAGPPYNPYQPSQPCDCPTIEELKELNDRLGKTISLLTGDYYYANCYLRWESENHPPAPPIRWHLDIIHMKAFEISRTVRGDSPLCQ
jgi:hypothetical protein